MSDAETKINLPGDESLFEIASHGRAGLRGAIDYHRADLALIAGTVRGSPQVMVKSGTRGAVTMAAVRGYGD
ncbi:hypothetical protein JM946_29550 [Steroidobacter sp. S1-65]|uniref:Uncharacterized protein n=1 Tax=Steroidobacter gossypii TaxID=2805490 RepID=A0ABS1X6P1_9GAMM|nr:hypothetical protein [Steroidobacter gossypii]MBM0108894.1 hypothetical protein [Steroidobacter gossypii]